MTEKIIDSPLHPCYDVNVRTRVLSLEIRCPQNCSSPFAEKAIAINTAKKLEERGGENA